MKPVLHQYYYAPHYNLFGVWQWDSVNEENGSASGRHIVDFRTREEAREYVYFKNGWGTPKSK